MYVCSFYKMYTQLIFCLHMTLHAVFSSPVCDLVTLQLHLCFYYFSTAAAFPKGPRIFFFPSSPLSSGSPHHNSAHLLRSVAVHSFTPPHSGYASPVGLRKSVSFNEELLLTASGRIDWCEKLLLLFRKPVCSVPF